MLLLVVTDDDTVLVQDSGACHAGDELGLLEPHPLVDGTHGVALTPQGALHAPALHPTEVARARTDHRGRRYVDHLQ